MGVLVQIRDVPEQTHRVLKSRAAASGTSLSEYLRAILTRSAERPTPEELWQRIKSHEPVRLDEPSEHAVRRLRDQGE